MKTKEFISTIYNEDDFGRSCATVASALLILSMYLLNVDLITTVLVAVIVFPITRIISSAFDKRRIQINLTHRNEAQLKESYDKYTEQEKQIIEFFVHAGGSRVSYNMINENLLEHPFPRSALNSLMQRGVAAKTLMEDSITEGVALETNLFDLAHKIMNLKK